MPLVQIELSDKEDALLTKAAEAEKRSKRGQAAFAVKSYCTAIVENTVDTKPAKKKPTGK